MPIYNLIFTKDNGSFEVIPIYRTSFHIDYLDELLEDYWRYFDVNILRAVFATRQRCVTVLR
jgi:hypothetical protein